MVTETKQQRQAEEELQVVARNTLVVFEEIYVVEVDQDYYRMIYPQMEHMEEGNYENAIEEHFGTGKIFAEDRERVSYFLSIRGMREQLKEKNYVEEKYRRTLEGGQVVWCLTSLTVLERKEQLPVTVIIAIRNIEAIIAEEEKQKRQLHMAMQKAEAANLAKADFLSRMSHDIRTPINTIMGMTEIAKSNLDDKERVLDCFKKITLASNHLLAMINEVLDMSKIDTGKMTLRQEPFSMEELLENFIAMAKSQTNEKHHTLNVTLAPIEHKYLLGDSVRIQQVFMNMISNAVKYTPEGGNISITMREVWESGKDYSRFLFEFKDNGIGMSREFRQKIFEPYEREKNTAVENIQGTGLGMYISHKFISMMGGEIQVESEVGVGTCFTVIIPLRHDSNQRIQQEEKCQAQAELEKWKQTDFSGKRILLVEDNEFNQEIAQVMLESVGIQVVIAPNGQKALQIFNTHPEGFFDMIFMDIQMPGMNGYETTRRIRALGRGDASQIPIIAMTADVFAEDVQAAKDAGMNEHMGKPLEVETLRKTLCRWL